MQADNGIGYFKIDSSEVPLIEDMIIFEGAKEASEKRHILIENLFKARPDDIALAGMTYQDGHIVMIQLTDGLSWDDKEKVRKVSTKLPGNKKADAVQQTKAEKMTSLIEAVLESKNQAFLRPSNVSLYPGSAKEIDQELSNILNVRSKEAGHKDSLQVGAKVIAFDGETATLAFTGACKTGECGAAQKITMARVTNGLQSAWPMLDVEFQPV